MERNHSKRPKQVIVSTNVLAEETFVFECDKYSIISYDEYGGLALRWGNENWRDPEAAVESCFPNDIYVCIESWDVDMGYQFLFELREPDELTYWDGDETDKIMY